MITIGTQFNWYSWCFEAICAGCTVVFPLHLPLALPTSTPMWALHKIHHRHRIPWHTTGFE